MRLESSGAGLAGLLVFGTISFSMPQTTTSHASAAVLDLNSAVMESTFKIEGPSVSATNERRLGTGFLMGRAAPEEPNRFFYVLVTAAHVLNGIGGETATLVLPVKSAGGEYQRAQLQVPIRKGARVLWTQHRTADVAAMYIALPQNVAARPIPPTFLATDGDFEHYEMHPGDEVFTAGYPYGLEANSYGFPILRSGRIASFPLTPAVSVKTFMVDFSVFGGNSGGPIFINQLGRLYGSTYHLDERVFKILGIVSNQVTVTATGERLNVAGVVHATFIKEVIAGLPARPPATQ